jgi:hypothetical protein
MVVVMIVDAVAPLRRPTIVLELRLEGSGRLSGIDWRERVSREHNRQARMVRDPFMALQLKKVSIFMSLPITYDRSERRSAG